MDGVAPADYMRLGRLIQPAAMLPTIASFAPVPPSLWSQGRSDRMTGATAGALLSLLAGLDFRGLRGYLYGSFYRTIHRFRGPEDRNSG
jgi:hypothetical protein